MDDAVAVVDGARAQGVRRRRQPLRVQVRSTRITSNISTSLYFLVKILLDHHPEQVLRQRPRQPRSPEATRAADLVRRMAVCLRREAALGADPVGRRSARHALFAGQHGAGE